MESDTAQAITTPNGKCLTQNSVKHMIGIFTRTGLLEKKISTNPVGVAWMFGFMRDCHRVRAGE